MKIYQNNLLNKIFTTLCALSLSFASMFIFSACGTVYHSLAGTMSDIAGTYKLTRYIQKDDNGNPIDRINQLHVNAYLVVDTDGYGYYAYQDDETEFWYDSILIHYNTDDENPNLYKSIQFTRGISQERQYINKQKPGNGYEPVMGFNANNKTFNYFIPDFKPTLKGIIPSYYTDVVYTKISTSVDLSKISAETNRYLTPMPEYELKNLNGVLVFTAGTPNHNVAPEIDNPQYDKYKYYVVDFNATTKTADIYYERTEGNDGAHIEYNVAIPTYIIINPFGTNMVVMKFFDQEYIAEVNPKYETPKAVTYIVNSKSNEDSLSTMVYYNVFWKYENATIEEAIAIQLENYAMSQN